MILKKLYISFLITLLFITSVNSNERSEDEIKIGIFLEDVNKFGEFKKIDNAPKGMFPETSNTFHLKQIRSQKKFIDTFVKQKGLMEKYTDRVIIGMGYFEFFYMQQLKDNKKDIIRFKKNYPNINAGLKKKIKKIYGLNKARKSMRESVGLSLDDNAGTVLQNYYVLYKLLNQAEIETFKLTREEKKIRKFHNNISKNVSKLKSLVQDSLDQRITDKKFDKEYSKNFKKLLKDLKKTQNFKDYELLTSFILEIDKNVRSKKKESLSGFKISEFILQNIKKEKVAKKYNQDLSNAKFDSFSQEELETLGTITASMKMNKSIKSNEIQIQILNLENSGIPINRFLDVYRNELNVKLETINLQVASSSQMKDWKLSDWANAWKNPIPKKIVNDAGIEITLSSDNIESVKAQLAMQNFKEMLDLDDFKDIMRDEVNSFQEIAKELDLNSETFEFSFTLDDFAKSFGDIYGLDINNYSDLTNLANAQHGANWSVEEYASAYQANVDIVNALQSGELSSFDAGQIAAATSTSLQEVADTITAATNAGVSVDLEATAQGLGYGSFADAVAAYNAEHGTNYTTEEAKAALGQ
jgi:hypothetical protein